METGGRALPAPPYAVCKYYAWLTSLHGGSILHWYRWGRQRHRRCYPLPANLDSIFCILIRPHEETLGSNGLARFTIHSIKLCLKSIICPLARFWLARGLYSTRVAAAAQSKPPQRERAPHDCREVHREMFTLNIYKFHLKVCKGTIFLKVHGFNCSLCFHCPSRRSWRYLKSASVFCVRPAPRGSRHRYKHTECFNSVQDKKWEGPRKPMHKAKPAVT